MNADPCGSGSTALLQVPIYCSTVTYDFIFPGIIFYASCLEPVILKIRELYLIAALSYSKSKRAILWIWIRIPHIGTQLKLQIQSIFLYSWEKEIFYDKIPNVNVSASAVHRNSTGI